MFTSGLSASTEMSSTFTFTVVWFFLGFLNIELGYLAEIF